MSKRWNHSVGCAVAILSVAACGGGSSGSSITPIPSTDPRCPGVGGIDVKTGSTDQVVCFTGSSTASVTQLSVGDPNCPAGGLAFTTTQADGGTTVQNFCNTTTMTVASVTQVAVGDSHCPSGGLAITTTTPDAGVQVQYVCNSLQAEVTLPAGDPNCPSGGTEIESGSDDGADGGTAGDGILEPGEITSAQFICNAVAVTQETQLPVGDGHCPTGGVELQTGLDNGVDGGFVASSTQYICANTGVNVGSLTPPPGDAGPYTINLSGGNATDGEGGEGGELYLEMDYGSNGGHIKTFATGYVDAGFTVPAEPKHDFGTNEMTVTSSVTVTVQPNTSGAGLSSGSYFTLAESESPIYLWTGAEATEVTGISISKAGKLTFDVPVSGYISVSIPLSVSNAGTITTSVLADGVTQGGLEMYVGDYWGAAGSSIALGGAAATGSNTGGGGGYFYLYAENSLGGAIVNQGTIDTSGGDGSNGGDGDEVYLYVDYGPIINTGTIKTHGGAASGANSEGGNAGEIEFYTDYGDIDNSGPFDAWGGVGAEYGGEGGYIELETDDYGAIRNSGKISAFGGDVAAACASGCEAGDADELEFETYNGDILNSGDLLEYGGAGAGGEGGYGESLYVYAYLDDGLYGDDNVARGNIRFSGNIDTHGGSGATANEGGEIEVEGDYDDAPYGQEIAFLGYGGGINVSGGSGTTYGGEAGEIYYEQEYSYNDSAYGPGGSIINSCNINGKGGAASAGEGGEGSSELEMYTQDEYVSQGYEVVINTGNIDISGGNGTTEGGEGGEFFIYGIDGVTNSGSITSNGGNATAASSSAGEVQTYNASTEGITADNGPIINSGNLSFNGGNATAIGGEGGNSVTQFNLRAPSIINSGNISCNGGNGAAEGGDSANIVIRSISGTTQNTGTITNTAGTGTTKGTQGTLTIDGSSVGG